MRLDQHCDDRDEVELPDQRLENGQVARGGVVAVANRRESHEAEVQGKATEANRRLGVGRGLWAALTPSKTILAETGASFPTIVLVRSMRILPSVSR
jgi:hypothetical protein